MNATEQAGLLQDIIANPADDGLRLVYADWLDENGQEERAEFIRVQVADPAPLSYELRGHAPRGERIFSGDPSFDEQWLMRFLVNLLHGFPFSDTILTFHRGFLSEVKLPMQAWLDHGKKLVMAHPIEKVVLSDRAPRQAEADELPGDPTGVYWYCYIPGQSRAWQEPRDLPADIFGRLPDRAFREGWGNRFAFYPNEGVALDALSSACISLAKETPE